MLLETERDARSNTGNNLRKLLLQTNKYDISQIQLSDIDTIPYFDLPEEEEWRLEMHKHLMEERQTTKLNNEDQEWLEYLCCQ